LRAPLHSLINKAKEQQVLVFYNEEETTMQRAMDDFVIATKT
jgi:hypothetical protein